MPKLYLHLSESIQINTIILPDFDIQSTLKDLISESISHFKTQNLNVQDISVSTFQNGKSIQDNQMLVSSFFQENSDVFLSVDSSKIQKVLPVNTLEKIVQIKYQPITKYTFYDHNDKWAKCILEIQNIETHPKEKILTKFFDRSLEICINDFKNQNLKFGVPRTQCQLNTIDSKITIRENKITIWIRKIKKEDNWFALYKQKTVGGEESD